MTGRFCKDCRHAMIPPSGIRYARCARSGVKDEAVAEYLVTGEALNEPGSGGLYCSTMRLESQTLCGRDGKLWEAKT